MKHSKILSSHRNWIHADLMRKHFDIALKTSEPKIDELFLVSNLGTYMTLWYGLLFSVCEHLKSIDMIPENISLDVKSIIGSLKLFRNAAFHVQTQYHSEKLYAVIRQPDSAICIRKIHNELGLFFLDYFNRHESSH